MFALWGFSKTNLGTLMKHKLASYLKMMADRARKHYCSDTSLVGAAATTKQSRTGFRNHDSKTTTRSQQLQALDPRLIYLYHHQIRY